MVIMVMKDASWRWWWCWWYQSLMHPVLSSLSPSILYGAVEMARSCSNLPPLQVHTHHPITSSSLHHPIIISSCHFITPSSFYHVTSSCLMSPPGSSMKYLMAFKRSYVRRSNGKCCDQSTSSSSPSSSSWSFSSSSSSLSSSSSHYH